MKIADDGTKLIITSTPMLFGKILSIIFIGLGGLFPIILVASLVLPARKASIDCDRARGSCDFALSAWKRTVPLSELTSAKVDHRHGSRNSSPSNYVEIYTRDGKSFPLSASGYHDEVSRGFHQAVDGFNQFLSDPNAPSFKTEFVSGDTDWFTLILFTLICPVAAWFFLKLWVVRQVEIDRGTRMIRVAVTRKIGANEEQQVSFSEVRKISLGGSKWVWVTLNTSDRDVFIMGAPNQLSYQSQMQRIVQQLSEQLGLQPEFPEDVRVRAFFGKA